MKSQIIDILTGSSDQIKTELGLNTGTTWHGYIILTIKYLSTEDLKLYRVKYIFNFSILYIYSGINLQFTAQWHYIKLRIQTELLTHFSSVLGNTPSTLLVKYFFGLFLVYLVYFRLLDIGFKRIVALLFSQKNSVYLSKSLKAHV